MTNGDDVGPAGWQAIERRSPRPPDVFAEWYEAWRAQVSGRRAAEAAERITMRREIRWMSGLIATWSLVMGAAAVLAIRIVL